LHAALQLDLSGEVTGPVLEKLLKLYEELQKQYPKSSVCRHFTLKFLSEDAVISCF
jgi:hypothetical protein